MIGTNNFPRQQLSYKQKGKTWRKSVVDWADNKSYVFNQATRKSFINKKINIDLYNGKANVEDMKLILSPGEIDPSFIPDSIQHYPIASPKIDVLVGEEARRKFDFNIIVTNQNAISQKEREKSDLVKQRLEGIVTQGIQDEQVIAKKLGEIKYYLNYEYQDMRETRANFLVNHYMKELDVKSKWNRGFKNALIFGEESYIFSINQGEPTMEVVNPRKLHVLRNGYSSRIEDADVVIYDDMWSPGRIIDTYYNELTAKEIEYLEKYPNAGTGVDNLDNINEADYFVHKSQFDSEIGVMNESFANFGFNSTTTNNYFDSYGNVRLLRIWWKSRRKVLKVKSYDPIDGSPIYTFHTEDYIPKKELGEEVEVYWINEAWQGAKAGQRMYIGIKPMEIQFNRISNPSRCHFGIIGEIYSTNESIAVSFMDRMKPYQYLYDAVHGKLVDLLASNYGKIAEIDIAKIPDKWKPEEWLYYAKKLKIGFVDSFKEGNKGAATGKLAGAFNTVGGRTLDLDQGNAIQYHISILQWIEQQIGMLSGVSKQREGSINSSETVGGIERSIVQSTAITEEIFLKHDSVKKRCLETLIEISKIALKGNKKKMQYILDDGSISIYDLDGDDFCEADYGIVVDDNTSNRELMQKMDNLAHAALQSGTLNFSSIMSIYTDTSLSSIRRKIEMDEKARIERESKQAEEQNKIAQQQLEQQLAQFKEAQAWDKEKFYVSEENKLRIAAMKNDEEVPEEVVDDNSTEELAHKVSMDEKKHTLEREKFNHQKTVDKEDLLLKNKALIEKVKIDKMKAKQKPKTTK